VIVADVEQVQGVAGCVQENRDDEEAVKHGAEFSLSALEGELYGTYLVKDGDSTRPVWSMFKNIRYSGLDYVQIGIVVRRLALKMKVKDILQEQGWVSSSSFYRRYRPALEILKRFYEDVEA